MGLLPEAMGPLRSVLRDRIERQPEGLGYDGDELLWVESVDEAFKAEIPAWVRQHFWDWVRDIYTWVPADRPNWSLYRDFFFQWSVGMRTGKDKAGCFVSAERVYRTYYTFLSSRNLKQRIREAKDDTISAWDERVLSLPRFAPFDEELDDGEPTNLLGIVESTATMNYFQQFWDFLCPALREDERERLYTAVQSYYNQMSFFPELVAPSRLTRSVR